MRLVSQDLVIDGVIETINLEPLVGSKKNTHVLGASECHVNGKYEYFGIPPCRL